MPAIASLALGLAASECLRADDIYQRMVQPLLRQYCFDCHSQGEQSGEVAFDSWNDSQSMLADQETWQRVRRVITRFEMPPPDQQQPNDSERKSIVEWIDSEVLHIDCNAPDPGRVTIRRLNRSEYQRTIRDLVGVEFDTSRDFPVDPSGHGFDNLGDVLSLPPVLMEKYLKAAEQIASAAIVAPADRSPQTKQFPLDLLEIGYNARQQGNGWVYLNSTEEDDLCAVYTLPVGGRYQMRVRAYAQQFGERPIELTFLLGESVVDTVPIEPDEARVYECSVHAAAGKNLFRVAVRRIKDGLSPEEAQVWKSGPTQDGAVLVQWLEIAGPNHVEEDDLPQSHRRLFAPAAGIVEPTEVAEAIFTELLPRAYRRPVSADDVQRVIAVAESSWNRGASVEEGIQHALIAVLVAPRFLYRAENTVQEGAQASIARLDDYALAARLSYFLWGSMPDAELFGHARAGTLSRDDNLAKQVRRMLSDPKAESLVKDFAGQWFELRNLPLATPDPEQFSEFDEPLRAAMQRESELLFESVLREDRSVLDLITANYTFLNERLARHYGIRRVEGEEFRRVELAGTNRQGVLTHASILTLTSNPTRTSPVKRGKWVLENILGAPPPPPPPNVPQLDDRQHVDQSLPLRARMEQHRRDPNCASCHRRMDDIGFAFENFDAIGALREHDQGQEIDASGELFPGEQFRGATSLIELIAVNHRDQFARCMAEKMLTYALGRGLEIADECAVDKLVDRMRASDYRFSSLVLGIVESVPFQFTRIQSPDNSRGTND